MKLGERALVAIGPPEGDDWPADDPDVHVVSCSACGVLTDPGQMESRAALARFAYRHAEDVHDGDVDRKGWA